MDQDVENASKLKIISEKDYGVKNGSNSYERDLSVKVSKMNLNHK